KVRQHSGFGPFLPEVYHVPFAYCYRCAYGKSPADCALHCVRQIEDDLFARQIDPKDVAAIFVEPIQGEGGYIVPPDEFLPALRALCDRHGILLVCDEVQTGVGRTGRMFASEYAGVEPDIITVAKGLGSGLPIGAFIGKESLMTWEAGAHGSTFGGNPVACAAALATLDLVEREYLPNVGLVTPHLMAGIARLAERFGVIGDVRGKGLMVGIEFVPDRATRRPHPELVHELVLRAFAKGLLLLSAGKSSLRLAPPLVVGAEEIDVALGIIGDVLAELVPSGA